MTDLPLSLGLEDNVLTALCFGSHAIALRLAEIVSSDDPSWSSRQRQLVADASIRYIMEYERAPGVHIADLLEYDLSTGEHARHLKLLLEDLYKQAPQINAEYIIAEAEELSRWHYRTRHVSKVMQAITDRDEAAADALLEKAIGGGAGLTTGLEVVNAVDLFANPPRPLISFIDGLLIEGVTLLSGAPKIGKSILSLQMALAIASGKPFLDQVTQQSNVLYLALEPGCGGAYTNLNKMTAKPPRGLDLVFKAPRMDQGLINCLKRRHDARPYGVCVIDMGKNVWAGAKRGDDINEVDIRKVLPFSELAQERHIAVIILVHHNKAGHGYMVGDVAGTYSLTGAADYILNLTGSHGDKRRRLRATGRYIDSMGSSADRSLTFDPATMTFSDAGSYQDTSNEGEERVGRKILKLLHDSPASMDSLMSATGKSRSTVFEALKQLRADGLVIKGPNGLFTSATRMSERPVQRGGFFDDEDTVH